MSKVPTVPTHGPSGALVTESSLSFESGDEMVRRAIGPRAPDREEDIWDEDGNFVDTRVLSEEEYRAKYVQYEKALKEWDRTGGISWVKMHPDIFELKIVCADLSSARGIWDDEKGEWVWVEQSWVETSLPPNTVLWSDGTTEKVDDILKRIPRRQK